LGLMNDYSYLCGHSFIFISGWLTEPFLKKLSLVNCLWSIFVIERT